MSEENNVNNKTQTAATDGSGNGGERRNNGKHYNNHYHNNHNRKKPADATQSSAGEATEASATAKAVQPQANKAASESSKNTRTQAQNNKGTDNRNRQNRQQENRKFDGKKQNDRNRQNDKLDGNRQKDYRNNRKDNGGNRRDRNQEQKQTEAAQTDVKSYGNYEDLGGVQPFSAFSDSSKSGSPFDFSSFSLNVTSDAELDKMPPDPTLDQVFGTAPETAKEPAEGIEVVGVHFPQGGKVYWFGPNNINFNAGDPVIVETARGTELGEIAMGNHKVPESDIVPPLRPVIRKATKEDLKHESDNNALCTKALTVCAEKVAKHKLDMKLVGAQYTFDNAKLIFYFTAAARVDFRELVKDLASEFHTRIELRQIGIRDEAKMLGGLGVCGRKLCCSTFLPNFAQSTVKMAKEQGLSLNSSKISGNCGRLMCCLRFEQSTYESELAIMPPPESVVETPDGRGVVTEVKPVGYTVKVKLDEKQDQPPRAYALKDIKVLKKAAYRADSDGDGGADNSDALPDN